MDSVCMDIRHSVTCLDVLTMDEICWAGNASSLEALAFRISKFWLYVGYLFSGRVYSLCVWWYIYNATMFDVFHLFTLPALFSQMLTEVQNQSDHLRLLHVYGSKAQFKSTKNKHITGYLYQLRKPTTQTPRPNPILRPPTSPLLIH